MALEDDIVKLLDTVVSDLEARADYGSVTFPFVGSKQSIAATNAVQVYTGFKEEILLSQSKGIPVNLLVLDQVQAVTSAIITSNLAMIQMGQLSLSRTITPKTAEQNNVALKALSADLAELKATTATGSIVPSETQKLYGPKET